MTKASESQLKQKLKEEMSKNASLSEKVKELQNTIDALEAKEMMLKKNSFKTAPNQIKTTTINLRVLKILIFKQKFLRI